MPSTDNRYVLGTDLSDVASGHQAVQGVARVPRLAKEETTLRHGFEALWSLPILSYANIEFGCYRLRHWKIRLVMAPMQFEVSCR
jgi:hypothetical protein